MREKQRAAKQAPKYDRRCLRLSSDEIQRNLETSMPHTIRLKVPQIGKTWVKDLVRGDVSFQNSLLDDQILLKSDGFPTYHLAVVVDDHLMEISHVVRAEEWLSSTPKHVLLYGALGWYMPFPTMLNIRLPEFLATSFYIECIKPVNAGGLHDKHQHIGKMVK